MPQLANVRITIPGQTLSNGGLYPCLNGGAPGIQLLNFAGGSYAVTVEALDSASRVLLSRTTQVRVDGNVTATIDLQWVVGSMPLRWSFLNQGATITCAQAQVANVFINLKDQATQRFVYVDGTGAPTAGVSVPCVSTNSIQGTLFPYLPAATYEVFLQAPITGNAYTYRTSQTQPPLLQVNAGVFAQSELMGQLLTMQ